MLGKHKLGLLFAAALIACTAFFIIFLQPNSPSQSEEIESPEIKTSIKQRPIKKVETAVEENKLIEKKVDQEEELISELSEFSETMRSIKQGKSSVLNLVFSDANLNEVISDLLTEANSGEAWANYSIGQIVDTCSNLHRMSESKLIEMFSSLNNDMPAEQQSNMTELMPIVVGAAKRCKSIDENMIKNLGGDARSWFRTGAEQGDANSFVISGYSMINERIKSESEEYNNASKEDRWKVGRDLRDQARLEFREEMRERISQGQLTPEAMMNMSEHLNLFYDDKSKFKQPEAWVLLACDMGYENNCGSQSITMKLKCMFNEGCQSGSGYEQGILYSQGQYELDSYRETAQELRRIFENKEWDKLGF